MLIYTDETKLHKRQLHLKTNKLNTAQLSELWVIAVTNSMRFHRDTQRVPGV